MVGGAYRSSYPWLVTCSWLSSVEQDKESATTNHTTDEIFSVNELNGIYSYAWLFWSNPTPFVNVAYLDTPSSGYIRSRTMDRTRKYLCEHI